MNPHELGFASFLREPGQRRFRALLELGPKRRQVVRALLDHAVTFDDRYAVHIVGSDAFAGPIEKQLKALGAPETCRLLSSNDELDGREMTLAAALERVVGSFDGTFISCLPGRLGYFEYEDAKSGYLLQKI